MDEAVRVARIIVINVANSGPYAIADDLRKHAIGSGVLVGEDKMRLPKFGGGYKYEPLFVMGEPKEATQASQALLPNIAV